MSVPNSLPEPTLLFPVEVALPQCTHTPGLLWTPVAVRSAPLFLNAGVQQQRPQPGNSIGAASVVNYVSLIEVGLAEEVLPRARLHKYS